MKRCPVCGGKQFLTVAHVMEEWLVDENEFFQDVVTDCLEVTHKPNDDNEWTCYECGYSASGHKFNVKE